MEVKPTTLMVLVALAFSAPAQCQEPKERFDRLSNSLADLSDEYANDTMKTISFLLLAMGWLITSEKSRAYLGGNRLARQAALTAIPALAMMHALTAAQTYFASQNTMEALRNLGYLERPYYSARRNHPKASDCEPGHSHGSLCDRICTGVGE